MLYKLASSEQSGEVLFRNDIVTIITTYLKTVNGELIKNQREATPIISWLRANLPMHRYGKWKTKLDRHNVGFSGISGYVPCYGLKIHFERDEDFALFKMFWLNDIHSTKHWLGKPPW